MNGIQRINKTFAKNKAFVGYLTAGDGGIEQTLKAALALIEGGMNLLEIGMPFSDPIADGPVIQRASERAIKQGTTMKDIFWLAQQIRLKSDIPLVLFSYFNPILKALKSSFLHDVKQAGIDGLLIVDSPIEEMQALHRACLEQKIAPIYVITPSTPLERIRKISRYGRGFLYYACRKGTTGLRNALPEDFEEKIQEIKSVTSLPVVVGFGISEPAMVTKVLKYADGVVVGSLFVKLLEEQGEPSLLTAAAQHIYFGGI